MPINVVVDESSTMGRKTKNHPRLLIFVSFYNDNLLQTFNGWKTCIILIRVGIDKLKNVFLEKVDISNHIN